MASQMQKQITESDELHEEMKARLYAKQIDKLKRIREEQGLPPVPEKIATTVAKTQPVLTKNEKGTAP